MRPIGLNRTLFPRETVEPRAFVEDVDAGLFAKTRFECKHVENRMVIRKVDLRAIPVPYRKRASNRRKETIDEGKKDAGNQEPRPKAS